MYNNSRFAFFHQMKVSQQNEGSFKKKYNKHFIYYSITATIVAQESSITTAYM
jgi:hypothetical protein